MRKNKFQKGKWFSDIHLNWDAVSAFISDVKVKNNITTEEMATAVAIKSKPETAEREIPKHVDYSVPLEKNLVDRNNTSNTESTESSYNQAVAPNNKEIKEEKLIDIVEDLDSCAKARRGGWR